MNFVSVNINGVSDDRKSFWIKSLKGSVKADFIGIQESHQEGMDELAAQRFWDKSNFTSVSANSVGRLGGLVSMWNPDILSVDMVIKSQKFLLTSGLITGVADRINILNIHAPNEVGQRRLFWDEIAGLISRFSGLWLMLGDFNEVRSEAERINSRFDWGSSDAFNDFISNSGLLEYSKSGGEPKLVDSVDRGLIHSGVVGKQDLYFAGILKVIKQEIKKWRLETKLFCIDMEAIIDNIENKAISGLLTNEDKELRIRLRVKIDQLELRKTKDLQQKARANWLKFGDENSSFFHKIIEVNSATNRVHGLIFQNRNRLVTDPTELKEEIRLWFKKQFAEPIRRRPEFDKDGLPNLSDNSRNLLCEQFSEKDIVSALKGCDGSKAPGPYGFSLKFFKVFWEKFKDIWLGVFKEFHSSGNISEGFRRLLL
ncbi:uncharacterized protein LOC110870446 [Helianthus annuus]|uniref:uncharacterized protein LOC110870446 n=1 Tax=Helianthus annuus TaxID=4232 RepID=UPI000B8F22A1|nr:uncharacterized protein LOC110870446 [Helianthus annuus]